MSVISRNNKGFTLIEIILSLAIVSIIITMIVSFFDYGITVFSIGDKQYNVQSEIRLASDYVVKNTRFATSMELVDKPTNPENPSGLDSEFNYLYIENGKLYHFMSDGASHKKYTYGENISGYTFSGTNNVLNISLSGYDDGRAFNVETEIDLANMSIKNKAITNSSGEAIKYKAISQSNTTSYKVNLNQSELIFPSVSTPHKLLSYTITPNLEGHVSSWTSLGTDIATVTEIDQSSVNVVPQGTGNTFIQLVIEKDEIKMTSNIPVYVLGDEATVVINETGPIDLNAFQTKQLTYTTDFPPGDSISNIVWSSENSDFASVNSSGLVTGKEDGINEMVYIYIEIYTAFGGYDKDGIAFNILPALKLSHPNVSIKKAGGKIKDIDITNGTAEATVTVYTSTNQIIESIELNSSGAGGFKNLQNGPTPSYLVLSKEGFEDSDPYEIK